MKHILTLVWQAVLAFCRKDVDLLAGKGSPGGDLKGSHHEFMLDQLVVSEVRTRRRPRLG